MDQDLICSWLGLTAGCWPPDHYTLLGLPRGESDAERIEHQVHERLARLRPYQLNHPDQVTEAMNRLAQAFTCLTDPEAKRAYDRELFPDAEQPAPATLPPVDPAQEEITDPLAWLFGPWSQAVPASATTPAQILGDWVTSPPPARVRPSEAAPDPSEDAAQPVEAATAPEGPGLPVPEEPEDPHREAAHLSPAARRGLGTKRALYHRIAMTRRLLRAWEAMEGLVGRPERRLTRLADAAQLTQHLAEVRTVLRSFPPILGGAGQPGYFVFILARQQLIVPTFRALLASQREELARDWRSGRDLLRSHLRFLRREVSSLRRQGRWLRMFRAARGAVTDQPGYLLLFLGLLALLLSIVFHFSATAE